MKPTPEIPANPEKPEFIPEVPTYPKIPGQPEIIPESEPGPVQPPVELPPIPKQDLQGLL